MIARVRYVQQLWKYLGPGWLAYRLSYAVRMRSGLPRFQWPMTDWESQPLREALRDPALADPQAYLEYRRNRAPVFFFAPADRAHYQDYSTRWDTTERSVIHAADEIERGILPYFEHTKAQVGFPPDWFGSPFTGDRAPATLHWSQVGDFGYGDIKVIWEPSRFGSAYTLVRAYWRTGNEQYAELFWKLLEDWRSHNPPQQGPNWKCGQETSFRVMAWCFALYGLLDAQVTTPERVVSLVQMIAISGQRIEANLSYALSQRNNHGISEGMGLWTIGTLFPELRSAEKWREKGRQVLEVQGRDLIYDDGAFVQHSVNYHRLMLHDYLWVLRLAELQQKPFSAELKERVRMAATLLYQLQDEQSGQVPCYGSNDGALILPLNNCDYRDFRPVLQAAFYVCSGIRCYNAGPWDEDLFWLGGRSALDSPIVHQQRSDLHADAGGYYTLRSDDGFAFVRCATFRDRPGDADMLHVDLWWRGHNLALDAGTYSYNAPAPWNHALGRTASHNTVTVDGLDQMNRASKFLWLPWLQSRVCHHQHSPSKQIAYWEGEHNGYQRLPGPVEHRRGILRLGEGWWLVLDRLNSSTEHSYKLHWLLLDAPYEWAKEAGHLTLHVADSAYHVQMATLSGDGTYSLMRADEQSARGWRSPYYNSREPALSFDLVARASTLSFWTLLGPEPGVVEVDDSMLRIRTEHWQALLHMQSDNDEPLIGIASIAGAYEDTLEVS